MSKYMQKTSSEAAAAMSITKSTEDRVKELEKQIQQIEINRQFAQEDLKKDFEAGKVTKITYDAEYKNNETSAEEGIRTAQAKIKELDPSWNKSVLDLMKEKAAATGIRMLEAAGTAGNFMARAMNTIKAKAKTNETFTAPHRPSLLEQLRGQK